MNTYLINKLNRYMRIEKNTMGEINFNFLMKKLKLNKNKLDDLINDSNKIKNTNMIRQINNNLEREKNPKEPSVMQKEFRSKVLAYLWVEGEDTSNPTEEEIRLAKEEQMNIYKGIAYTPFEVFEKYISIYPTEHPYDYLITYSKLEGNEDIDCYKKFLKYRKLLDEKILNLDLDNDDSMEDILEIAGTLNFILLTNYDYLKDYFMDIEDSDANTKFDHDWSHKLHDKEIHPSTKQSMRKEYINNKSNSNHHAAIEYFLDANSEEKGSFGYIFTALVTYFEYIWREGGYLVPYGLSPNESDKFSEEDTKKYYKSLDFKQVESILKLVELEKKANLERKKMKYMVFADK